MAKKRVNKRRIGELIIRNYSFFRQLKVKLVGIYEIFLKNKNLLKKNDKH
ncbi:hypothetical protein [Fusobacterium ulcerans]|nr:hypothetical protein [Fusobacterium ulcerans]MEE0137633.1 hypothetical protein [Fusobacterium ulcerans]